MSKMKVYNDNVHPYRENFKGEKIEIPAKGFIVMDYDDATQFRGTFSPPVLDVDNNPTPEGFKMIRIEPMTEADAAPAPKALSFNCNACKYKGTSAADLAEHGKFAHSDEIVTDEAAEQEIKTKSKQKRAS